MIRWLHQIERLDRRIGRLARGQPPTLNGPPGLAGRQSASAKTRGHTRLPGVQALTVRVLVCTKSFAMLRVWVRRIVLAVLGAGAAGVLALWLEHRLPTELPAPTGTFALGRTSYTWDDMAPGCVPAAIAAPAHDYLPPAIRTNWEHERPAFINFLTRDLSSVRGHSANDVAISNAEPNYPVVILRAGGSGSALNFSSLAEDLASHGYVVVGLDIATTANPELCAGRNDDEDCATKIRRRLSAASAAPSITFRSSRSPMRASNRESTSHALACSVTPSAARRPHSSARRTPAAKPASTSMAGRLAPSLRTEYRCRSCFCSRITARRRTS